MIALPKAQSTVDPPVERTASGDVVVLIHGLGAHPLTLSRLAANISRNGYHVVNWGYVSWRRRIDQHVEALKLTLGQLEADDEVSRIHFVAHSMGSIITRAAMLTARPRKTGRIVMLSPPNRGSFAARRLARPFSWLCPSLAELSDDEASYVNQLPAAENLDVGIVAAASDRVVPRSSTHLPGQRDWILLPGHHGALPWRAETSRQAIHFLEHGHFLH